MPNPIVQQINEEMLILQKELGQFKSTVEYLNNAKAVAKDAVLSVNKAEEHFYKKVEELKNTYEAFIKLSDTVSSVVSKINTVNFPERLDSIEKTVKETINSLNEIRKATLDELQKASEIITKADFDGRFKKLQISIDSSVESNKVIANSITNQKLPEKIDVFEKNIKSYLDNSITDLKKNTKQISEDSAKSIKDLNLPIRMDKLDANIAGIISAIQNVQSRIESVERNIGDKLKDSAEKQSASIIKLEKDITQKITKLSEEFETAAKKQLTNTYITWALIAVGVIATILICKPN